MKTKTVYICDGCGEIIHPDKDEHYLLNITGEAHNFNLLSGEQNLRAPVLLHNVWDLAFHGVTGNCLAGYLSKHVKRTIRKRETQLVNDRNSNRPEDETVCTPPEQP
jgi:hypothetical protein